MKATREMMVEEGVKRMKMLKILPNPIKEFKKHGKLNLSEVRGMLYWLDEEQEKMVKKQNSMEQTSKNIEKIWYQKISEYF